MLDVISGGRPAGDILSRVVRITLSGQTFILPVRSIRANREWKAALDVQTAGVVNALVEAGDDNAAILAQLATNIDPFIELLVSYAPTILSRDLIEGIEPDASMDVIAACQEVWLAATPLLVTGLQALMDEPTLNGGSPPTSSPPPSGDGSPTSSSDVSPTSSSSDTSTPPPTGSSDDATTSSTAPSSLSARRRSSPATSASSSAGSGSAGTTRARRSGSPGRPSRRR